MRYYIAHINTLHQNTVIFVYTFKDDHSFKQENGLNFEFKVAKL